MKLNLLSKVKLKLKAEDCLLLPVVLLDLDQMLYSFH